MTTPCFFEQYLARYDADGGYDCPCGRRHSLGIRRVVMGPGVITHLPGEINARYGTPPRIWMLSDENTRAAAGGACHEALGGFPVSESVLPASPRPATTVELADTLSREAASHRPELILAVGAGTVSDLGKMVSLALEVPNWCVATAASADAYGSGTAATKWSYRARAVPCRPTEVILCDLDVLLRAPRNLFLAGLGDLLAKFLAFLDWNVASLVTGEYFCPETATAALGSARRAIEAAAMESSDAPGAVRSLMDAAITSSFAMQAVGYSRPAASAEHSVGHYWEISHSAANPERELHGMLVGLASRVTLAGYTDFYAALPALKVGDARIEARLAGLEGSAPWQDVVEEAMRPYRRWLAEETDLGLYNPETVRAHLERYRGSLDPIEKLARVLLGELEAAVRVLEGAGYPFRLRDYGLSVEQAFLPFRYTRGLRNRYSSFGLMHELGVEGRVLETIRHEIESLS